MIRDPDALAAIINELSDALEPPRAADGQLARHAMERARYQQVRIVPQIMARLALKANVDDVAEILADLAVEHGIVRAEANDELRCLYCAKLDGQRAAASAHNHGPLAPHI